MCYSQVPEIRIKRDSIADWIPNSVLVNFEIMRAPFRFLHVNNLKRVPLDYDLCFYRMAFLLPE